MAENEIALLQRFAANGDAEAFSQIVHRHAGLVYWACQRVVQDQSIVADLVQETFLQLVKDADKITSSVPNWLHRVATRKALTSIRSDTRRRKYEAKYAADRPLETTNWEDISVHVDEEMDNLADETREALIEHFFEGRSMTDIAAAWGVSRPTVSRRIESGVVELRSKLRARGLVVGAAALGTLLLQNAAQAAPAVVLEELGKIAIVGSSAAAASVAGGAVAASSAGAKAAGVGIFASVQAKIVTVAAVAAVGVGGVVTYNQTKQPSTQPKQVTKSVDNESPEVTITTAPKPGSLPLLTGSKRVTTAIEPEPVTTASAAEEPFGDSSTDEAPAATTSGRSSSKTPPASLWSYSGGSKESDASEEETTEDSNSSEEEAPPRRYYYRRSRRAD